MALHKTAAGGGDDGSIESQRLRGISMHQTRRTALASLASSLAVPLAAVPLSYPIMAAIERHRAGVRRGRTGIPRRLAISTVRMC
jgi:hypothetical protein